jgi:hypothetical protein
MNSTWNAILTAVLSGAVGAVGQSISPGQTMNWKGTGIAAGFGALLGVANLFRKVPKD